MADYNYLLDPVVGEPLQFQLAINKVKPRHWRNKATAQVVNLTGEPLWVKYLGQNGTTLPVIDPSNVTDINTYRVRTPIAYWKEADYHETAQADIADGKVAFIDDSPEEERYPNTVTTDGLAQEVCELTVKNSVLSAKKYTLGTVYPAGGETALDLNGANLVEFTAELTVEATSYVDTDFILVPIVYSEEPTEETIESWFESIKAYGFTDPADQNITVATAGTNFLVKPEFVKASSEGGSEKTITLKSYWLDSVSPVTCMFVARQHTGNSDPEKAYIFSEPGLLDIESVEDDTTTEISVYLIDKSFDSNITSTISATPNCYIATGDWLDCQAPTVDDAKVVLADSIVTVTYPALESKDYRIAEDSTGCSIISSSDQDTVYAESTDLAYETGSVSTETLTSGNTYTLTFSYTFADLESDTVTKAVAIS